MVVLGLLHFCNVYVFNSIRRRARLEAMRTPPLAPQHFTPTAGQGAPAYPA